MGGNTEDCGVTTPCQEKLFRLGAKFLTDAENFIPGEVLCFSLYCLIVAKCHYDPNVLALCMQV